MTMDGEWLEWLEVRVVGTRCPRCELCGRVVRVRGRPETDQKMLSGPSNPTYYHKIYV